MSIARDHRKIRGARRGAAASPKGAAASSREPRRTLRLRLADGSPAEAFERLAAALDCGDITVGEARQLADVLERRLRVVDSERIAAQLQAIRARADEAVRLAAGSRSPPVLPAARRTVEVEVLDDVLERSEVKP